MVTPTTRATWFNENLVHHVLVQPRYGIRSNVCDVLIACLGYRDGVSSVYLGPYTDMITCISCLGTNWEATVKKMDEDGLLTKTEALHRDAVLHRILFEGKAFADSALRNNRR